MSFWFIEVVEAATGRRVQLSNLYANEAGADRVREWYRQEYPEADGYMVHKTWIWWEGGDKA